MKRLVVTVTVSTLVLMLLSATPPAQAASGDGAILAEAGPTFHALSRMPDEAYRNLAPLTDDELDSVVGAAGGLFGAGGLAANLGIIVQINVCAVCVGVGQANFGFLGQRVPSFGARP
jgi:hypothetical protein